MYKIKTYKLRCMRSVLKEQHTYIECAWIVRMINLASSTNSHIRDFYIEIRDNFSLFNISLLKWMKIANVYIGLNVVGLKVNVNPNLFQVLKIDILFDFHLYLERS